ncbi:MAG: hypothetical protein WCO30_02195 [bacterium]
MFENLKPIVENGERMGKVNFAIELGLGEEYPQEFEGLSTSAATLRDGRLVMNIMLKHNDESDENNFNQVSYEAEFINGHWLINWDLLTNDDKESLRNKAKAA